MFSDGRAEPSSKDTRRRTDESHFLATISKICSKVTSRKVPGSLYDTRDGLVFCMSSDGCEPSSRDTWRRTDEPHFLPYFRHLATHRSSRPAKFPAVSKRRSPTDGWIELSSILLFVQKTIKQLEVCFQPNCWQPQRDNWGIDENTVFLQNWRPSSTWKFADESHFLPNNWRPSST